MTKSALQRLQDWYLAQCDEDWEHLYCVKIGTLDNPGWFMEIDLNGTPLESRPFQMLQIQRESEHDWVYCKVKNLKFSGACGPQNLEEMLCCFFDWAELPA